MSTRSERIFDFTNQSRQQGSAELPTHPRLMTREEVLFLVKMNCEELMELLATVVEKEESTKAVLIELIEKKAQPPSYTKDGKSQDRLIEEQVDALVDIDYYNGNGAAKAGFNMDAVFDVVHQANMNKRFVEDGKFHRNEEGKIIKPSHWQEGDVGAVVQGWIKNGTWGATASHGATDEEMQ